MCPDMPVNSPARDILTLPLPPSYETTLENRLSHHLASPTLTRTQLVDTLSTLASNLLPSNTPSPFRKEPSNLTALDENTRAVYSLFRSIHLILHALPATTSALATCLSASPFSSLLPIDLPTRQPHIHATAFSLSQKLPGSGTQADWFTSPVTKQQVEVLVKSGSQQQSPNEAEITTDNADDREAMEQDETGLAKATQSGMNWFGKQSFCRDFLDSQHSQATQSLCLFTTRSLQSLRHLPDPNVLLVIPCTRGRRSR